MSLDSFYSSCCGNFNHDHKVLAVGLNTLVPAVAGKRISVTQFLLSGDATVTYELRSGTNPIFKFYGMEYFGVPLKALDTAVPLFLTNSGEALTLFVSGTVNANVHLHWQEK